MSFRVGCMVPVLHITWDIKRRERNTGHGARHSHDWCRTQLSSRVMTIASSGVRLHKMRVSRATKSDVSWYRHQCSFPAIWYQPDTYVFLVLQMCPICLSFYAPLSAILKGKVKGKNWGWWRQRWWWWGVYCGKRLPVPGLSDKKCIMSYHQLDLHEMIVWMSRKSILVLDSMV
jgi:hypothetical protein